MTAARSVLGIDAAWTAHNPSGVALVEEASNGWRLRAVAPSYHAFQALAGRDAPSPKLLAGSRPDASALIEACVALTGSRPRMIAIDMPLSREPIVGRRASDRAVSSAYGAKRCATHSPSAERPGTISDNLRAELEALGYGLWTKSAPAPEPPGFIEVYPHPALVELTGAPRRLEYKAGKTKSYWPSLPVAARKKELFRVWAGIVAALNHEIAGVADALPAISPAASGAALKAYEDALDAVICAWVGVTALRGHATPYGDATSAVWVPALDRGWRRG